MAVWLRGVSCVAGLWLLGCEAAPISEPKAGSSAAESAFTEAAGFPRLPPGRKLGRVLGLAIDAQGRLWVSQDGEGKAPPPLLVLDGETGEIVKEVPLHGVVTPHALSFDAEGLLWITDSDGDRLVALNTAGEIVRTLGQ